jgi:hypothetical protein
MIAKEELKRMAERPGFNEDGTPIQAKLSAKKKAVVVADKVVDGTVGRAVRPILRFANRRILGRLPEEAITGSFQEEKPIEEAAAVVSISTPEVTIVEEATIVNGSGANGHSVNFAEPDKVEENDVVVKVEIAQVFKTDQDTIHPSQHSGLIRLHSRIDPNY